VWIARGSDVIERVAQDLHGAELTGHLDMASTRSTRCTCGRDNPNGAFVDWNPNVSCEAFVPNQ
jgi:hypothetical protein